MGLKEFFNNVGDLFGNTVSTGAKLSEATVKLLNQLVKAIDWLIDLPEKAEDFAYKSWTNAKHGISYLYRRITRPAAPSNLPKYQTEMKSFFESPFNKKWGFILLPGKENKAYRAAAYQRRICYLSYKIAYNGKLVAPIMKEYKKVNRRIIEMRRDDIKRRKERKRLKEQLVIINERIDSGQALGPQDPELQRVYNRRRQIMTRLSQISKDVSPIVKWPKFVLKKINYPRGSRSQVSYLTVDPKHTRNINIFTLQKQLSAYLTPYTKQNVVYAKEINKLAYWRDVHLKASQDGRAKASYENYKRAALKKLKTLKAKLVTP